MTVRNINASNMDEHEVVKIVKAAFKSRGCPTWETNESGVFEYSDFGNSRLAWGVGRFAVVAHETGTRVRIELQAQMTGSATLIGVLSLAAGFFTVGLTLLLFFLLCQRASASVVHELDVVREELKEQLP